MAALQLLVGVCWSQGLLGSFGELMETLHLAVAPREGRWSVAVVFRPRLSSLALRRGRPSSFRL